MSRATPDDQLKFLLSCVRHSNNGKASCPHVSQYDLNTDDEQIDFVEVAKECGVVSKGAAAKRYERLLKANGIHPNGGVTEKPSIPPYAAKPRSKADITKAAAAKRRKIEGDSFSPRNEEDEDEDDFKGSLKRERLDSLTVKPEHDINYQIFGFPYVKQSPPVLTYHTTPLPRFITPSPFAVPPEYPLKHFQNTPVKQIQPPPVGQDSLGPAMNNDIPIKDQQVAASSSSQTTSSVTEEQINSMFEEFCSQDLFKQSDFGVPTSALNTKITGTNNSVFPPSIKDSNILRPEPRQHSLQLQIASPTSVDSNTGTRSPQGGGGDIHDCILISD